MDKLLLGIVVGIVLIIAASFLNAFNNYYSSLLYSTNNCYNQYPPVLNNNTYVYPVAYYSCNQNVTKITAKYQLYSSLLAAPELILYAVGALTIIVSISLMLIREYKNKQTENHGRTRKR